MNFGCCNPSLKCKIVGDMAVMQAPCPPSSDLQNVLHCTFALRHKELFFIRNTSPKPNIFNSLLQPSKISSIRKFKEGAKSVVQECRS